MNTVWIGTPARLAISVTPPWKGLSGRTVVRARLDCGCILEKMVAAHDIVVGAVDVAVAVIVDEVAGLDGGDAAGCTGCIALHRARASALGHAACAARALDLHLAAVG